MTILTTAPTIDASGISAPAFADVLDFLQAKYRAIYGSDVYLGNDSQDGQFLAILAAAINDSNAAAVAVYNALSPATAQGNGLSSVVKINGIKRLVPSASQATVTIVGQAYTVITHGVAMDAAGRRWSLPSVVTIPSGGSIDVTATCQTVGAIAAAVGQINLIATPTRGWQSVTNAAAATQGAPVESDAALRVRQGDSVALPSQTVMDGLVGALRSLAGVTQLRAYENETNTTDANGIPAHSIAMVIQGGDSAEIGSVLLHKRGMGVGTYGSTEVVVTYETTPYSMRYSVPTQARIVVHITVQALTGYTSAVGDSIKAGLAAYVNALGIGEKVRLSRLYLPAQLDGADGSETFEVTALTIAAYPGTPGASDVAIAWNAIASLVVADIALTVV